MAVEWQQDEDIAGSAMPELEHEPVTPLGRRLRDWRWDQRPSWTRSKLARALNVSRPTVTQWEHANVLPRPPLLPVIAQVTGIPLAELYRLCGYEIPSAVPALDDPVIRRIANLSDIERARFFAVAGKLLDDLESGLEATRREGADEGRQHKRVSQGR
jgi:transcriptional regulator with XRE-family HTH domain